MAISYKKILRYVCIALLLLSIGFALSSGLALNLSKDLSDKLLSVLKERLFHHILTLEVDAKHYFLFPTGSYSIELFTQPLSFTVLMSILINSIFNILFQPVFLCPFTPQAILNLVLFPFFLCGIVRYFRKAWLMLIIFVSISFHIGIYDAGVESLLRHGMSCELIYLLIGSAGFTGLITKSS